MGTTPNRRASRDARAHRSRSRLQAAVLGLLASHYPQDISVSAVAAAAGMTRQTFYQHYTDITDVIVTAVVDAIDDSSGSTGSTGPIDPVERLRALLRFAEENVSLHETLHRGAVGHLLEKRFADRLTPLCTEMLGESITSPKTVFAVGGIIRVISQWSQGTQSYDLQKAVLTQLYALKADSSARPVAVHAVDDTRAK